MSMASVTMEAPSPDSRVMANPSSAASAVAPSTATIMEGTTPRCTSAKPKGACGMVAPLTRVGVLRRAAA